MVFPQPKKPDKVPGHLSKNRSPYDPCGKVTASYIGVEFAMQNTANTLDLLYSHAKVTMRYGWTNIRVETQLFAMPPPI